MQPFKALIVEDEFTSRLILQSSLQKYGEVHIAVNGQEAIEAVNHATELNAPYDLICLDMIMPEMTGQEALKAIRERENKAGIAPNNIAKIIMTTSVSDGKSVITAFKEQCDAYMIKPIDQKKLLQHLRNFKLI